MNTSPTIQIKANIDTAALGVAAGLLGLLLLLSSVVFKTHVGFIVAGLAVPFLVTAICLLIVHFQNSGVIYLFSESRLSILKGTRVLNEIQNNDISLEAIS